MTYAIIETGGKQMKVEAGRFYDIELLTAEPDEKVTINAVLLVHHEGALSIGQPLVEGATVEGTIMRHFRGRKVLVYKMKPKKKTRKKRGHRQEITRFLINSINLNGEVLAYEEAPTSPELPVIDSGDSDFVEEIAEELSEES
jgi:large subunit ribosomal protein L21